MLGPGLLIGSAHLGYYQFDGRLEETTADTKRFEMQDLDLTNENSTRYFALSRTNGVYPLNVDGFVKKEEVFNG